MPTKSSRTSSIMTQTSTIFRPCFLLGAGVTRFAGAVLAAAIILPLCTGPAGAANPPQKATAPAPKKSAAGKAPAGQAAAPDSGQGIATEARNAYVVDYRTGAVLLDKNGTERMAPASMSKMMFYYTVFDDFLKTGKATMDDTLPVSEKAWRTQGSKMFVPLGGRVRIEDLLRGIIVQSGNDACIVLAEGLAGSEQAMVDLMNKKAQELGLAGSHFANVTGLPDPEHYMTAKDLTILAKHIIDDFPEYYKFESEKDFTYNGIKQGNRNPLLYQNVGADGLKTGHTDEAGYCLTGSAIREGQRIIMVLAGLPTMKSRITESERVLDWAFREFGAFPLFKPGDTIDQADVWLGAQAKVPLTVATEATVTIPRRSRKDMKVTEVYDGPIKAPIAQGQQVGKLVVTVPGMAPTEFPLVAAAPVDRLGRIGRVGAALGALVFKR
ncbi:MAG: D-alanyl-D-alanine carboxypeptidase [Rhodospirillales bacterium]|nr:D-alanyl-D-alanine carboxypeptidase [Rhodospirillales bacterium]